MFDLSWAELLFCAMLALVVVGPKDMPKLLKMFANGMRTVRKFYGDAQASMKKLEQEVDAVSLDKGEVKNWQDFLPPDIQRLPDSYRPGSHSAEQLQSHQTSYQQAVDKAKAEHAQDQVANNKFDH